MSRAENVRVEREIEQEERERNFETAVRLLATRLEILDSEWSGFKFNVAKRARITLVTRERAVEAIKTYYLEVPYRARKYLVLYKRVYVGEYVPEILTVVPFEWYYERETFTWESAAREILRAILDYETCFGRFPIEIVDVQVEVLGVLEV
jgi:predicted Zn-dependent protease